MGRASPPSQCSSVGAPLHLGYRPPCTRWCAGFRCRPRGSTSSCQPHTAATGRRLLWSPSSRATVCHRPHSPCLPRPNRPDSIRSARFRFVIILWSPSPCSSLCESRPGFATEIVQILVVVFLPAGGGATTSWSGALP